MQQSFRLQAVALLIVVASGALLSQPARTDAIWARTVPAGTITLDGILNESAWAKAESLTVRWGQNNGDPGSGYYAEVGANNPPSDPTNATIKFLVSGDSLYVAVICKDSSIGGGLFNKFDGFLMNIRDRSSSNRPIPAYEYFYGWVTEPWADTSTGLPGAAPNFFGFAGGKRTDSTGGVPNRRIWDAKTKVYGSTNDDTKIDTSWVTEFKFNLSLRGYDVTKTGGDIVMYSMSIYDADWQWPLDTVKFHGNRTWLQCPWSNTTAYGHLRIFADPTVTTSTSVLPTIPYDLTIYNGQNLAAPTIDGKLDEQVWKNTPGFDIRFGDNTLRSGYKNTIPYRSGQYQPSVNGQTATVLDPADATIKMFYKGDTLYVGAIVRDKVVQFRPEFDRQDGFKLNLRDRAARDPNEHRLMDRELYARVDSSAKHYALEGYAPVLVSDTLGSANNGSRIVLGLNSGTTLDTLGAVADSGYQVEMKINLRALGYPAGRGDGVVYVGGMLNDGDTYGNTLPAYGDRVWFAMETGSSDAPAFAYMDPTAIVTSVSGNPNTLPGEFELHGAYPNPFNPSTTIEFSLPRMANVKITVFDLLGRSVSSKTLYGLSPGRQGYRFDASILSSGAYFYQLQMLDIESGAVVSAHSGKMMLLK